MKIINLTTTLGSGEARRQCKVHVELDEDGLVDYLAARAYRNKTKRARIAFAKATVRPLLEERKQAALAAINDFVASET